MDFSDQNKEANEHCDSVTLNTGYTARHASPYMRKKVKSSRLSWWGFSAIISIVILLALNIETAKTAIAPRAPWDEIAPLQMAHRLAGLNPNNLMSIPGYLPGWGILLTPIWWITQNPQNVYHIAIGIVILLAMITIIPLARIATRLGLSNNQSITAAALTLSLPARTVNADYTLSENLIALLIACTVLAAFRLWESPSVINMLCLATVSTLSYLSHARALLVVLVVAIWLIFFFHKNWKLSFLGLASIVTGYFIVKEITALVMNPIMLSDFEQDSRLFSHIEYLKVGRIIRIILQQIWVQLAGSYGVVAIGFFFIITLVWKELKQRFVGPHSFVLGLFFGAVMLSTFAMIGPMQTGRFDIQVYSRYLDPFAMIIVLYSIAAIINKVDIKIIFTSIILVLTDILIVCLQIAPWMHTWGTMDGPANSAAVLAWARLRPSTSFNLPLIPSPSNGNSFWFWGSIASLSGILFIFLFRKYRKLLTISLVVSFSLLSLYANPSQSREYPADMGAALQNIETLTHMKTGTLNMDFDISCRKGTNYDDDPEFEKALNWSGFWFLPRTVTTVNPTKKEKFNNDIVISCADWPQSKALGAKAVKHSGFETYQLWVLPGELQNKLMDAGALQ